MVLFKQNHCLGYIEFMEKELAILKAENRQLFSKVENEKLTKPHQEDSHRGDNNVTANQIATLEAKILEYSRTISKFILTYFRSCDYTYPQAIWNKRGYN